jgi:hypothetical protein
VISAMYESVYVHFLAHYLWLRWRPTLGERGVGTAGDYPGRTRNDRSDPWVLTEQDPIMTPRGIRGGK